MSLTISKRYARPVNAGLDGRLSANNACHFGCGLPSIREIGDVRICIVCEATIATIASLAGVRFERVGDSPRKQVA